MPWLCVAVHEYDVFFCFALSVAKNIVLAGVKVRLQSVLDKVTPI